MVNPTPIREGKDVVRYAANGRRIVVRSFGRAFDAALYRRRLIATDWGRKGNPNGN